MCVSKEVCVIVSGCMNTCVPVKDRQRSDVRLCVFVCVCVCVGEREREIERYRTNFLASNRTWVRL